MTTSTKSRSVDDAEHLDVNFVPFAITTIVAASASFEPLLDTRPISWFMELPPGGLSEDRYSRLVKHQPSGRGVVSVAAWGSGP